MIDIFSYLKEYKEITQKLFSCIENDNYDDLNGLVDKRESIINIIDAADYEHSEFENVITQLDIISLQNKLDSKMNEKKSELLNKINGISKNRIANNSYYKKNYEDSLLFNKKI